MSDASVDFVVIPPDGHLVYGQRRPGEAMGDAIRVHIPDLGTQGLDSERMLRMWFADTFTADMPLNPTADLVINHLGYWHQDGWYGPVAVSMEENRDGQIPPLTNEMLAIIQETLSRHAVRMSMDRTEHLAWAKQRALAELDADPDSGWVTAMSSIQQDFALHDDLAQHDGPVLMLNLAFDGHLTNNQQVREFINGLQ